MVRRRRLETVRDTVLNEGHKQPTVSSNNHYEGSTQHQRPVTNYILLAQSRSARYVQGAHVHCTTRYESYRPLAKVQISRQIKSFSRRSSWLEFLPRFPEKPLRSGSATEPADPPLPSVLVSRRGELPREIERAREGPPRPRGSAVTWCKLKI